MNYERGILKFYYALLDLLSNYLTVQGAGSQCQIDSEDNESYIYLAVFDSTFFKL